jgi:hypothetical protein
MLHVSVRVYVNSGDVCLCMVPVWMCELMLIKIMAFTDSDNTRHWGVDPWV